MEVLEQKTVAIRKPHNCWGCRRLFPIKTEMEVIVNADSGRLVRTYWCGDCQKFMATLAHWQVEDGFDYGGLLEFEEYKAAIEE